MQLYFFLLSLLLFLLISLFPILVYLHWLAPFLLPHCQRSTRLFVSLLHLNQTDGLVSVLFVLM